MIISKPDSTGDLAVYIISLIFSFEITNVVVPDPKFFEYLHLLLQLLIKIGIQTLSANGSATFFY